MSEDIENRRRVERVRMMAEGSSKWDLSPKDLDALRYVLFEREELKHANAKLRAVLENVRAELGAGTTPHVAMRIISSGLAGGNEP